MTKFFPKKISSSLLSFIFLFSFLSLPATVLAKPAESLVPKVTIKDSAYAAQLIKQSDTDPIVITAGKSKTVVFTFKNTGTATWDSSSKHFISAYTMEPRNRKSLFASKDWINSRQTGRVIGKVKPGKTGELAITFKAPTKPGEYIEKLYLSSENHTWVKNGYFFAKIKVVTAGSGAAVNNPPLSPAPTMKFPAQRIFLNPKNVTLTGGQAVPILFGFQNIGNNDWTSYTIQSTGSANVADVSWQDKTVVQTKTIGIGKQEFLRDTLILRAPAKAGSYVATFKLMFNGDTVPSATLTIPITVTADAPSDYVEPFAPTTMSTTPDWQTETPRLSEEPNIRVGVWKNPKANEVRVISSDDDYDVYSGADKVGVLSKGVPATLTFDGSIYSLTSDLVNASSTQYLHLQPSTNPHAMFTLTNFDRHVTGKSKNFNQYRGGLELRQARDQNQSLYLINELKFEDYMVGIGENSNSAPPEYLKAQAVAQRTYAYYTQQSTGKHDSRNFDVVATTGDQLYLGAANEPSMSHFIDAVNATRGLMVTYNNNVVVTPYFGNSDGRTRGWVEAWGGKEKPWLVSVPATYDARDGKKMYGHGVGMSQRDAAYRADEEGVDFVGLLKYYYTGTEIHKIY